MIIIGRQDKKFPETAAMLVSSDKGFPRYYKRYNARGNRKFGSFHVRPNQRIHGNAFSDFPAPAYAGQSEPRAD